MLQKQPPRGALKKSCSENMQQIYRRTAMPKCDFNKAAKQSNFIEITLRHGCSPVNLLHIFRTPFPNNTSGRLLLVLRNRQTPKWLPVKAGVPQGSILEPLFLFICINDNVLSKVKLFVDDALFSVVNDSNISANELNKDLQKVSEWAYEWIN